MQYGNHYDLTYWRALGLVAFFSYAVSAAKDSLGDWGTLFTFVGNKYWLITSLFILLYFIGLCIFKFLFYV